MTDGPKPLSREALLAPKPRRVKQIELPSGELCYVRSLTEREWSAYTTATLNDSGKLRTSRLQDATRRLIILCLCDENGSPLLRPGDMEALAEVDSSTTQALYNAARDHIGVSQDDIEELAKNSSEIRADG